MVGAPVRMSAPGDEEACVRKNLVAFVLLLFGVAACETDAPDDAPLDDSVNGNDQADDPADEDDAG